MEAQANVMGDTCFALSTFKTVYHLKIDMFTRDFDMGFKLKVWVKLKEQSELKGGNEIR